jgi:hypothetical protein
VVAGIADVAAGGEPAIGVGTAVSGGSAMLEVVETNRGVVCAAGWIAAVAGATVSFADRSQLDSISADMPASRLNTRYHGIALLL